MLSRVRMQLKEQFSAASVGHGLLKKKSDHIKKLLQDILKQIVVVNSSYSTLLFIHIET